MCYGWAFQYWKHINVNKKYYSLLCETLMITSFFIIYVIFGYSTIIDKNLHIDEHVLSYTKICKIIITLYKTKHQSFPTYSLTYPRKEDLEQVQPGYLLVVSEICTKLLCILKAKTPTNLTSFGCFS